ncbi:beta strand repeat-containing protein [Iningainema tapete]|uniref:Filamentous hemagglutinin N-terminal domain-containing protein n=1 Tax=Iningainema tapete BLCC-T55 TaxID=2748662 RepID=A0A8J7CAA3_9CYAN|nr:filamentous hemagglutinin N-terminal domain-containing protein [Iningainema tapete]MBD2776911.1 filamentous hemagglutinin N-terminal domain-containing protein [Iningainema tapete BLCC-T55]
MTQRKWFGLCWQYTWVGVIATVVSQTFAYVSPALAQSNIVPDNTLGAESSVVIPNAFGLPLEVITGGAVRGANLFHSFQEFNVDAGRSVYFNADTGIQNILARVTGTNRSEIFGTLGTIGNAANLFLINPNGIIFGPNASLDVRGSFVASTANAIKFGEQEFFSATNPTSNAPLLTVNPSALFFNQIAAPIQNNSLAPAGIDPAGFQAVGLRVPDGKSLLLMGGNINMDRGQLNAYGGRVELGGLADSGTVALNVDGNNLSASFPTESTFANVSLTNGAGVYVEASGGGSIMVNAGNLDIRNRSFLSAGIGQGLGTVGTVAGDIVLNAKGEIRVVDPGSIVNNSVGLGSKGNGGNITINSGSFSLQNGALLQAITSGQGNAGNVTVRATDAVSLADGRIFSTVLAGGVGKGGDININAATLSLIDGATLITAIRRASAFGPAGRGDAGNVNVNVSGAVNIAGVKNGFSGISSSVERGTVGNAGNITINSGSFSLRDGAELQTSTEGQGNAGNIKVRATDSVSLANNALILSTVEAGGVGKGGDIDINAATLSLTDSAVLTLTRRASALGSAGRGDAGNVNVNVSGAVNIAERKNGPKKGIGSSVETGTVGNAGNITINSGSFKLLNGARLEASTSGQGNAGNVTIRATDAVSVADAAIFSTVEAGGVGKGGDIDISGATLSLIDGAQLQTATLSAFALGPAGRGNAGNVNVNVSGAVNIAGEKNGISSEILSSVETGTVGNGGNITINSGSFKLLDGARLEASTQGQGNAGNIKVRATDAVSVADARISSTVLAGGVGKGGDIDISGATLSLIDGAQLLTLTNSASAISPAGRGDAGNVNVNVSGAVNIAGGKNGFSVISSSVEPGTFGNGGNITINSSSFSLSDGVRLQTSTIGQGNAGNVTVRAKDSVFLANDAVILSTVEAGGVGKGGDININAATLSLTDSAVLTLTRRASALGSAGRGDAGNVNVNVSGAVNIAEGKNDFKKGIASSVETGTVGNGGNITINSGSFKLLDGARLEASTFGQGKAGNVTIRATDAVSVADARIFSTVEAGGVGKGGDIDISGATLSLIDGAQLLSATLSASALGPAGRGDAGNVNVNVSGAVNIAGEKNGISSGILSSVETGTVGNGGNITIDSGSFSLRDGARLQTSTSGQGNAGNVTVRTPLGTVSLADARIFSTVAAGGVGKGGDININAATLTLIDSAQLLSATRGAFDTEPPGKGDAGNVNLNVTGTVSLAGEKNGFPSKISSIVEPGTVGNGGNITINSGSFSLRDGALIEASTLGQGNAGTIKVNAAAKVNISGNSSNFNSGLFVNSQSTIGIAGDIILTAPQILLDNTATINAESALGNGGNINLQTDLLLLRRGAQISTTAGTAQAGGDGGNITINAPNGFIVARAKENSDITANAYTGIGGTVQINALGIYGTQFRATQTPLTSDITASSTLGVAGEVNINTPDTDPVQNSLTQLPENIIDANALIANSCIARRHNQSSGTFLITGNGGLPERPGDAPVSPYPTGTIRSISSVGETAKPSTSTSFSRGKKNLQPIFEALGIYRLANGNLVLSRECP